MLDILPAVVMRGILASSTQPDYSGLTVMLALAGATKPDAFTCSRLDYIALCLTR